MSARRILAAMLFVLALGAIAFLGYQIYQGAAVQRAVSERIQTLPSLELATLDDHRRHSNDLAPDRPLVLVYFDTGCIFCQAETRSLAAHPALLDTAHIVMTSTESQSVLKHFAKEYGLDRDTSIQVLRDANGVFADVFGVSSVPNTFIYDADRRLLQHFQGEASAEAIYRTLIVQAVQQPDNSPSTGECTSAQQHSSDGDCFIH